MSQIENVIRRLSTEPTYLLRRQQLPQQAQQQQNQAAVGGGGVVSEETRQKLLAQKRGVQGQQLSVPTGVRPGLASTSSSLNTLLSQPVDPPGGPTSAPYTSNMTARQTQQQQSQVLSQQQMALATAELLGEAPMDDFNAAMDKIAEDMAALRKKMGPVRSAQIDNEVSQFPKYELFVLQNERMIAIFRSVRWPETLWRNQVTYCPGIFFRFQNRIQDRL